MSAELPSSIPSPPPTPPPSSPSATERRSFPRHPVDRKALCQAETGPKDDLWLLGRSRDISIGGLSVILHRQFEPGTALTVELERLSDKGWESFQVIVRRATPRSDGFWILGCAFLQHLGEGQLRIWLGTGLLSPVFS
jgi:hypothetical protein